MVVTWDSTAIDGRVRQAAMRAVVGATEAILSRGTALIMEPPKTGRIYKRGGRAHQASAPGQAPANDYGFLAASAIAVYPQQGDLFQVVGFANWTREYASFLELGTARMAARPFARVALDEIAPTFVAGVAAELRAEFTHGGYESSIVTGGTAAASAGGLYQGGPK